MAKTKFKSRKSITKRFKLTGRKKLIKRAAGQDHFNSRDAGVRTMGKRRDVSLHPTLERSVRSFIPKSS